MNNSKQIKTFLLCMIVIVAIATNSIVFAASAGNEAFVTKEEFDNAIATFNSRLAVFEAGINSKIDAQVSSYLDRNGIWSKSAQDIKNSETTEVGFKPSSSLAYGYCYNSGSATTDITGVYIKTSYSLTTYGNGNEKEIVTNFKKNGLCFLKYQSIAANNSMNIFAHTVGGTYPSKTKDTKMYAQWGFEFYSDTMLKYKIQRSLDCQYPGSFGITEQGVTNIMFFVDKNKNLVIKNTCALYVPSDCYPACYNWNLTWEKLKVLNVDVY